MELHEDIWDMCEVPQMNKKSESTQGNLDDVWCERRIAKRRYKPPIIEDCLLRETTHDEKLEGQGTD
jgi:hypothetical protein